MYIIAKRALLFRVQTKDGREQICQVSLNPSPQLVPDWVRASDTFIYGEKDGTVVEVPPAGSATKEEKAEWSPYSELPQTPRDFVEAAELEAQSILEGTQNDVHSLVSRAREMGVSTSEIDFAPGNTVLQLAAATGVQGRQAAADHLFRITTDQYWKFLNPDVETFMTKLDDIWNWAYRKFQIHTDMPADLKRAVRSRVLRLRATAAETSERSADNRGSRVDAGGNAVDTSTNGPSWKDLRIEFESRTADYDELAADFDSFRPGKWELIRAASPRVKRIFEEIATKAAAKAGLMPSDGETAPWQLWLEYMWEQGWHRPEKSSSQAGSVRRERPWHIAKRMAEEGARTLPRVFQTSADYCKDREEREETSSAASQTPVAPGESAPLTDGSVAGATEPQPSARQPCVDESRIDPAVPMEESAPSVRTWPSPAPDFGSEEGRTSALAAYTTSWECSDAALARTALVDPADLSKWKKGVLPGGSEKKARIEKALRNNDAPTLGGKRSAEQ